MGGFADATTPIYLVRHAKAGHRERWDDSDQLRPLTKPGRRQAKAFVRLVAEQPFARLVSSPYVRCVQTFEPLAAARKMTVETADELAEGAHVEATLELMRALAADGPAALCTHGDVMQFAVHEVAAAGVPLRNGGPLDLAKGATWIFEVAGGVFTAARYVPPPHM